MDFIKNMLSLIADILGIGGFFLSILTYKNTQKLKSSDDRVSFRIEKDQVLSELNNNLKAIQEYNVQKPELAPVLNAMEEALVSIKRLSQYRIWDTTAKEAFTNFIEYEIQMKKLKAAAHTAPGASSPSNFLPEVGRALGDFCFHLQEIIQIVTKQK